MLSTYTRTVHIAHSQCTQGFELGTANYSSRNEAKYEEPNVVKDCCNITQWQRWSSEGDIAASNNGKDKIGENDNDGNSDNDNWWDDSEGDKKWWRQQW